MVAPEIELKFPVADVPAFRSQVAALPFTLQTDRTFEANTLYDTAERSLRARTQILRLREYGPNWVVTHKRLPDDAAAAGGRYKQRIETETEVQDGVAMAEVFRQLGYQPVFRYEKFRTEWRCPCGGHLVLDETAIGVWAEVEGSPECIDRMLEWLGVPHEACSTESYGTLFLNWKQRTGSPAENLTFAEAGEPAAAETR